MRYVLSISLDKGLDKALKVSNEISDILDTYEGVESTGSGCGFGARDITFDAPEKKIKMIANNVAKVLGKYRYPRKDWRIVENG